MNSKKATQKRHAKRRASERYGWNFNRHEMQALVRRIQTGDARFVERQSNRVSVWDLVIKDETARVVYDNLRKVIVTFLPKDEAGMGQLT